MFVFSVKMTKGRLVATVIAIALIICVIIIAAAASGGEAEETFNAEVSVKHVKTNGDRVKFLNELGWEVAPEAVETQEAVVPKEFNDTYTAYNELQKQQGFDLGDYCGKKVKRFTYAVLNYPTGEENVYANLLIYKNTVIGGDICCSEMEGFMHGLIRIDLEKGN